MAKLPKEVTSIPAIAARVRLLRKAIAYLRGLEELKQVDYCRDADLSTNTYNQWEKARGRPDLDGAMKLCDAFDVTLDWLYRGLTAGLPVALSDAIRNVDRLGGPAAKTLDKPPPFAQRKLSRSR